MRVEEKIAELKKRNKYRLSLKEKKCSNCNHLSTGDLLTCCVNAGIVFRADKWMYCDLHENRVVK